MKIDVDAMQKKRHGAEKTRSLKKCHGAEGS